MTKSDLNTPKKRTAAETKRGQVRSSDDVTPYSVLRGLCTQCSSTTGVLKGGRRETSSRTVRLLAYRDRIKGIYKVRRNAGLSAERTILATLERLGFGIGHSASVTKLREFQRARDAVAIIYDTFGDTTDTFIAQPLEDYGGESVQDLVNQYGVRALEAIRSDLEYPVPA